MAALVKSRLQHLFIGWVDKLYQRIHGKQYLPPWALRYTVGSPADFEVTGTEYTVHLKLLGGLLSDHHLLDIGCGCGMMALQLRQYLAGEGRYVGMDIDPRAVAWCQTRITTQHPSFSFYHADVQNPRYNPGGTFLAADYRFPGSDASFDVILLKSVFTHMQPDGVQNYLNEIARLLKPGARCLATFFLLNAEQASFARQGRSAFLFEHGNEHCRHVDPALPETAIAYREDFVLKMLEQSALKLATPLYYGTWSGRPSGLSFQDIVLITKD